MIIFTKLFNNTAVIKLFEFLIYFKKLYKLYKLLSINQTFLCEEKV